jgi:predicted GNAT superfamily acetyltransferase
MENSIASALTISLAETTADLEDILLLQAKNLLQNLTKEQLLKNGFVTVRHSLELLEQMNREAKSVIARSENALAGYCLAMPESFRHDIPVLVPMFEEIDRLHYKGKSIKGNYLVVGQVCVDERFRGQRVFDLLYSFLQDTHQASYPFLLTEIAARNQRSIKAHHRVDFKTIHKYQAPNGEVWEIVLWDWRNQ